MIFCIFIKLIWLGVDFWNRTGAEIGYYLHKKNAKNRFLLLKKSKNASSAQLWPWLCFWKTQAGKAFQGSAITLVSPNQPVIPCLLTLSKSAKNQSPLFNKLKKTECPALKMMGRPRTFSFRLELRRAGQERPVRHRLQAQPRRARVRLPAGQQDRQLVQVYPRKVKLVIFGIFSL